MQQTNKKRSKNLERFLFIILLFRQPQLGIVNGLVFPDLEI